MDTLSKLNMLRRVGTL